MWKFTRPPETAASEVRIDNDGSEALTAPENEWPRDADGG